MFRLKFSLPSCKNMLFHFEASHLHCVLKILQKNVHYILRLNIFPHMSQIFSNFVQILWNHLEQWSNTMVNHHKQHYRFFFRRRTPILFSLTYAVFSWCLSFPSLFFFLFHFSFLILSFVFDDFITGQDSCELPTPFSLKAAAMGTGCIPSNVFPWVIFWCCRWLYSSWSTGKDTGTFIAKN